MRRATLAVVLATGALSIPAVALAAGDGDSTSGQAPANNTPVQTQEQQPDQQQAPKRGDCPNHDGGGDSSSGGGSDSQTTL